MGNIFWRQNIVPKHEMNQSKGMASNFPWQKVWWMFTAQDKRALGWCLRITFTKRLQPKGKRDSFPCPAHNKLKSVLIVDEDVNINKSRHFE